MTFENLTVSKIWREPVAAGILYGALSGPTLSAECEPTVTETRQGEDAGSEFEQGIERRASERKREIYFLKE